MRANAQSGSRRSDGRRALAAAAVAWAGIAWGGCTSRAVAPRDDLTHPTPLAFRPCEAANPPVTLELLKVSPDFSPRKPSANLKHLLVDLRIQTRDQRELWLLVNEETFPAAVRSVSKTPEGNWELWGEDLVDAWWLGPAPNTSLTGIAVTTAARKVPATIATIDIDGVSPQRWGERRDRAGRPNVDVVCTTWLDLLPPPGAEQPPPAVVPSTPEGAR